MRYRTDLRVNSQAAVRMPYPKKMFLTIKSHHTLKLNGSIMAEHGQ